MRFARVLGAMPDSDTKGKYSVGDGKIPHSVTKVNPGVPSSVSRDTTPVQPIVINVPQPTAPATLRHSPVEVWHLVVAVIVAVVLSGIASFAASYVSSSFLESVETKIDKVEIKIDQLDQQTREIDSRLTRLEAQVANHHPR